MTAILNLPPAAIAGPNTATETLSIRTAVVLTDTYVYSSAVRTLGLKYLNLLLDYIKGDETSVQIIGQIGVSSDDTVEGTTWKSFWITQAPSSAGVSEVMAHVIQLTAANFGADDSGEIPINVQAKQVVRFGVKATGGTPTGTLGISATGSVEVMT